MALLLTYVIKEQRACFALSYVLPQCAMCWTSKKHNSMFPFGEDPNAAMPEVDIINFHFYDLGQPATRRIEQFNECLVPKTLCDSNEPSHLRLREHNRQFEHRATNTYEPRCNCV